MKVSKFMRTLPKYLTQDELTRFFKAITSPRDRVLFGLIYHYGLRVDEATAITVHDIDLKNHRIRILRLKNGIGGERPLWRHTAKPLRAYMRVRNDAGTYLFTGREGPFKKRMVQTLLIITLRGQASPAGPFIPCAIRSRSIFWKPDVASSTSLTTWGTRTSKTPKCTPRSPTFTANRSSETLNNILRSYDCHDRLATTEI